MVSAPDAVEAEEFMFISGKEWCRGRVVATYDFFFSVPVVKDPHACRLPPLHLARKLGQIAVHVIAVSDVAFFVVNHQLDMKQDKKMDERFNLMKEASLESEKRVEAKFKVYTNEAIGAAKKEMEGKAKAEN